MAKAAKASKTTKVAKKNAKAAGAASSRGKGKENATSKKQNGRSGGGGGGGGKKKSGGGSSAGGEGDDKKKSGGISKAVQKKIDAWWEKNSDSLVKKAMEEYNWEEGMAKDSVKAYQQFLVVKREMKDWENQLLPCFTVAAIIDLHHELNDYQSDMKLVCGHDFEGGQLVVYGKDDDVDREKITFEAVQRHFGPDFNEKLWSTLGIDMLLVDGGLKLNPNNGGLEAYVQKSTPLESAFEDFFKDFLQDDPEHSLSDLQFLLLRTQEVIDPSLDTALGLGLVYTDIILILHKADTLIEVKKKGVDSDSSATRLVCGAEKKKTMSKALKDLVKDDEGDESEYVFMFKDRRLYGFETPMSLQMKHFDTIEAIPAKDYEKEHKCQRCICCNNTDHEVEG